MSVLILVRYRGLLHLLQLIVLGTFCHAVNLQKVLSIYQGEIISFSSLEKKIAFIRYKIISVLIELLLFLPKKDISRFNIFFAWPYHGTPNNRNISQHCQK